MKPSEIIARRLFNQQIAATNFTRPEEIVGWFVAMQAQDFAMAKWAIGLRLNGPQDADIEKAFNDGLILRTHLLRPTWHFVTPDDIKWLVTLTAPRVNALAGYYYRQGGLDSKIFNRSRDIFIKTMEGGKQLTRTELQDALKQHDIELSGPTLGHLMMYAELEGAICSGARKGKQFTYALLDERAPGARSLTREVALAELTRRYFTSRGPATLQDFVYWSGLTMKDAIQGAASLGDRFVREKTDDKEYIFVDSPVKKVTLARSTFLMPDYDEYGMSYKDRSALMTGQSILPGTSEGSFNHLLVIDGMQGGIWKREVKSKSSDIKIKIDRSISKTKRQAVPGAVKRYKKFTGNVASD
jgi:hypothetical protein